MINAKHFQYDNGSTPERMSDYYYRGGDKNERLISSSVVQAISMIPKEAQKVLDVGCHVGYMGQLIKKIKDIKVYGVEFDPKVAEIARSILDGVECADIEETDSLPYEEQSFDCITFLDILEHLILPSRALSLCRKYLKPDGCIICSIPNVRHVTVFELLINPNLTWQVKDKGMVTDPPHLRFFTLSDIISMLRETGFSIQSPVLGSCSDPNTSLLNEIADRLKGLSILSDADAQRLRIEMSIFQWVFSAVKNENAPESPNLGIKRVPNMFHKMGDLIGNS